MQSKSIDLEDLLQAAQDRAKASGSSWVGLEHVLLELANAPASTKNVRGLVDDINAETAARDASIGQGSEVMVATGALK